MLKKSTLYISFYIISASFSFSTLAYAYITIVYKATLLLNLKLNAC